MYGERFILNEGAKYRIIVKRTGTEPWRDGNIDTDLAGFHILDLPFTRRPIFLATVPVKRDLIRPWFRVILRVGTTGTYEDFLDPDPTLPTTDDTLQEILPPKTTGELFIYVNDVALPVPYLYDYFYRNNQGQAVVTVQRL